MTDSLSFIYHDPEALGIDSRIPPPPTQQSSGPLPDTLDWNQYIQTNPQPTSFAPAPSQRPLFSQATSTSSSTHLTYLRPFAGKGLHTLDRPTLPTPPLHSQPHPHASGARQPPRSSALSKQLLVENANSDARTEVPRPGTASTQPEPRADHHEGVSREALQNITDTIGDHEHRLDRLETVSFSAGCHDDLVEKHDHMDLRVTELESRIDEVEKQKSEYSAVVARFTDKNDDVASISAASFTTTGTSRPTHSQELYSQLQTLQAQVNSLQAVLPSLNNAWEVEVVFLPFALRKLWQEIHHFKVENGQGSDEWTQLPQTFSTNSLLSQSPGIDNWVDTRRDVDWLLPRACSDKSITDRRLRSRGLIKKISIKGPDARSVQVALQSAFGDVWREMRLDSQVHQADTLPSKFMGLQSNWVPLRKIHKDSRLRFLSPTEMLTPAMWDVQFLHSVMMRSSEPRLFFTHPDAYMQDDRAYQMSWSWQRLQNLTPVHLGNETPQGSRGSGQDEQHWAFNPQLDEPRHVPSFTNMRNGISRTSTSSPSQQYLPDLNRPLSPIMQVPGGPSWKLQNRRGSRPPHIRTSSMPVPAQAQASPAMARRIVSGGQSRRSSPIVRNAPQFAVTKRRQTRSPSYHRFTPRWTASPSPMAMAMNDRYSAQPTTPFAYATPHSNAPIQDFAHTRAGSAAPRPAYDDTHHGDELYDVEYYDEDDNTGSEQSDEESASTSSAEVVTHADAGVGHDSQPWHLPEDEPWPGIEDQGHLSDGENIDPDEAERHSDASSQPSEYPSTQSAWPRTDDAEFRIHEDN